MQDSACHAVLLAAQESSRLHTAIDLAAPMGRRSSSLAAVLEGVRCLSAT